MYMKNSMLEDVTTRFALAFPMLLPPVEELTDMLRITTETKRTKTILSVEGSLSGPRVATLEQCWRELYTSSPRQKLSVNLCGVSFIDNAGKALLLEMHRLGADLIAEGCLNQAIVREIADDGDKKGSRTAKN